MSLDGRLAALEAGAASGVLDTMAALRARRERWLKAAAFLIASVGEPYEDRLVDELAASGPRTPLGERLFWLATWASNAGAPWPESLPDVLVRVLADAAPHSIGWGALGCRDCGRQLPFHTRHDGDGRSLRPPEQASLLPACPHCGGVPAWGWKPRVQ
jgi:hypothetical protein